MGRQPGEQSRGGGRRAGARASFGLVWFVCLLCVALATGSLLLAFLNGRTLSEIFIEEGLITLAILTATFCVVGALIASHRPGNSIGWIFCAAALCQGLSNFGFEYATYGLLTRLGSLPLVAKTSWLAQWIWAPGLGLILVFVPLLFPGGRAPSLWWHPVAWLGGLSVGLASVSGAIILWPERGARSTTRQRRLCPSPPGCATRRTSRPWAGISWGWWVRRCNRRTPACSCARRPGRNKGEAEREKIWGWEVVNAFRNGGETDGN